MRTGLIALFAAVVVAGLFLAAGTDVSAALVSHGGALPVAAGMMALGLNPHALAGVPVMAAKSIEDMLAEREELLNACQAIMDAADEADEDVSEENLATISAHQAKIAKLDAQISARQAIEAARTPPGAGRRTAAEPDNRGGGQRQEARRTVPATVRDTARNGFQHLGEFAATVRGAAMRNEGSINRLVNALGMNEGAGEDGGFLVPAEFREAIMKIVDGEDSLLPMTDTSTTSRNSVAQNVDKTTPWGTAGVTVYWEGEGQAASAAGAKFEQNTLRLNKLFARVDASDELLDDAPQLDSYLRVKAPEVITSTLNLAIVQGNGVGKPLGFMNSGALVTVSKETSQPADTIHHRNLVKMMGRMYPKSWPRSVWLMHQDVWAMLPLMSFRDVGAYPSTATVATMPVYMPPSGIAGAPYGTLFGRPIMVLQAMETIGDLGDIALVDLKSYRTATKAGGTRVDTSIHLKFDTDETVFRFILRVAGTPWWSSTISQRDGSNTLSPFVTLESR